LRCFFTLLVDVTFAESDFTGATLASAGAGVSANAGMPRASDSAQAVNVLIIVLISFSFVDCLLLTICHPAIRIGSASGGNHDIYKGYVEAAVVTPFGLPL